MQKNVRSKPGVTKVRAGSRGTSPPPVFSVLFWSFSLQRIKKYLNVKPSTILSTPILEVNIELSEDKQYQSIPTFLLPQQHQT